MTKKGILFDESAVRRARQTQPSQSDALRSLGLKPQADNYRRLRVALDRFGLDQYPSLRPRRLEALDDKQALQVAVTVSSTYTDILCRMGVPCYTGSFQKLREALDRHGIDFTPLPRGKREQHRRATWMTAEAEQSALNFIASHPGTVSPSAIAVHLGVSKNDTFGRWVADLVRRHDLHDKVVKRGDPKRVLIDGGPERSGDTLRRALRAIGRDEICAACGLHTEWNGALIVLHVDHIDGVRVNNTPSNLRFLCPNCHSQTATYCRRKPSQK